MATSGGRYNRSTSGKRRGVPKKNASDRNAQLREESTREHARGNRRAAKRPAEPSTGRVFSGRQSASAIHERGNKPTSKRREKRGQKTRNRAV